MLFVNGDSFIEKTDNLFFIIFPCSKENDVFWGGTVVRHGERTTTEVAPKARKGRHSRMSLPE